MSYTPLCLVKPQSNKNQIFLKWRSKQFFLPVSQLTKNIANTLSKIYPKLWPVRCIRQVYKIIIKAGSTKYSVVYSVLKYSFPNFSFPSQKASNFSHMTLITNIHSYNFSSLKKDCLANTAKEVTVKDTTHYFRHRGLRSWMWTLKIEWNNCVNATHYFKVDEIMVKLRYCFF